MKNCNFIICIAAVGEKHIDRAVNLIGEVNKHAIFNYLILTNISEKFDNFSNVSILEYNREIFSYHDKRLLLHKAFNDYNYVVLMDADHLLRDKNFLCDINDIELEGGMYPQLIWRHPADCSFENFILGKTPRVPYGLEYKNFCEKKGYSLENVLLIQESFIIFSKNENTKKFLEIWDNLSVFCDRMDSERQQSILGYGEGYSIGLAAKNSNLNIDDKHPIINHFVRNFKHLAWER